MFSGLQRLFGVVSVIDYKDTYIIKGLSSDGLISAIKKFFDTSKIHKNIFVEVGSSYVTIPKFFVVELIFILQSIAESNKTPRSIRNAAVKAIEEIYKGTYASKFQAGTEEIPNILDFNRLSKLKWNILDAQMSFLKTYNEKVPRYKLKGFLASMPPGTGKTFTSIALGECLDADLRIYIVPKNALDRVWRDTLLENYESEDVYWVCNEKRPIDLSSKCIHYVFNYEALPQALELIRKKKYKKAYINLDECHNMNEIKSQRTQSFIELCRNTHDADILWMSGTPLKALGSECIPLLSTIDEYFDQDAAERFKKIFGDKKNVALSILEHRMGLVTFKIPKTLVVSDVPIVDTIRIKIMNSERYTLKTIKQDIGTYIAERTLYYMKNFSKYESDYNNCLNAYANTLTSSNDQKELSKYRSLVNIIKKNYDTLAYKNEILWCNKFEDNKIIPALSSENKKLFRNAKTVVKCVNLKIQGEALGNVLGKRRAECHTAMVRESSTIINDLIGNAEKKTVIFSSFVETMQAAAEISRSLKYNPLLVFGGTNSQLNSIISTFEKDASLNPLCATYQSLSTAVPLIMANTMILCDEPFRHYIYEQAVSRINRLGQDTQTYVYKLQLDTGNEPNISTRSGDILEWSRQQIEAILGDANTSINLEDFVHRAAIHDITYTDSILDKLIAGVTNLFK